MIVYSDSKYNFMEVVLDGKIANIVEQSLKDRIGVQVSLAEFNSFQNSLVFVRMMLSQTKLHDDTTVSIEYRIPNTSKRIDFIISGLTTENKPSAVILELKQWQQVEVLPLSDGLVRTVVGGGKRIVTHPSYQAWSYQSMLNDYNENVYRIPIELSSCVFMHNYPRVDNVGIFDNHYEPYLKKSPVFGQSDIKKLSQYIDQRIEFPDYKKTIELIEFGKIKPSKSLQDSLANMLEGNTEFILIDEQKVIFEQAIALARASQKDRKKRVMIVEGGPGTGKSVVAINLMVHLTSAFGMHCRYVTKNSAPRQVYKYYLRKNGQKGKNIDYLFTGSGSFTDTPTDYYPALIVDEAHRLNEMSGMFENLGENQVKEIINSSVFSIFFIDHDQKIHIKDIGSTEEIKRWAKYLNAEVFENKLESQFRCNGSSGYLNWLDNLLEIRPTANEVFEFDYDFKVFTDLNEMRKAIEEKNIDRNKSRLLAGYCWNWVSKNNKDTYDILFDEFNFKMKWNLSNEIYAISDSSITEVGCIHTSQGLEFDYVGVIIGEDLTYKDGHIVTDLTKRAATDQSLKGIKGMLKTDPDKAYKIADEIIKNTYRTLMTRGMKGCYVYCVDNKLQDMLIRCKTEPVYK
jgi:uncharacterized protein